MEMSSCHPSSMPVDNKEKLSRTDDTLLLDGGVQYHQLVWPTNILHSPDQT